MLSYAFRWPTSMLVTDVRDEMWWRKLWDFDDGFVRFCYQNTVSFTLASETNIQKISPISKFCHQHRSTISSLLKDSSIELRFAMTEFSFPTSYWLHWWNSSTWVNEIWNGNLWDRFKKTSECFQTDSHCLVWYMKSTKIHKSARFS